MNRIQQITRISTFFFVWIPFFFACRVEVQACATNVVCTETGPPIWTYDYYSTGGSPDSLLGFKLSGVNGVIDTGAPGLFFGTIGSSDVTFEVSGCGIMCGTNHLGFWIEATGPGIENGTIEWIDQAYLSSNGLTNGPVFKGTPGPTSTITPVPVPIAPGPAGLTVLVLLCFVSLITILKPTLEAA